jgi:hypothetical protein
MENGWNNMISNPEKVPSAGAFSFSGSKPCSSDSLLTLHESWIVIVHVG